MSFKESMKKILLSGNYTDMEIVCQGFVFKVHQNIVCSQSPFFKAAMEGGFKVSINTPWYLDHLLTSV